MVNYLSWRTFNKMNKQIKLNFLLTGHTKFGPDRMFGILKSKFARTNVDCYQDFVQCVNKSSVKGHNVAVHGRSIIWRQWDDYLMKYYRTLTGKHNHNKTKFLCLNKIASKFFSLFQV